LALTRLGEEFSVIAIAARYGAITSGKEDLMSNLVIVVLVVLSTVGLVPAAEQTPVSPHAQRMKDCNAQARERALAGDARKQFMSGCLKGTSSGRTEDASPGSGGPREAGAHSDPTSQGKK
jgi:psiF repeat